MAALLSPSAAFVITKNSIFVQTERPFYFGGDTVQGAVYLNLVTPIESKGVHLKVKGYEKVEWEREIGRLKAVGKNDETFFKVKLPLHTVQGQFAPGQYVFPFAFSLPSGLPGVLKERRQLFKFEYEAQVRYKVKAECDLPGKSDIKYTHDLTVCEVPVGGEPVAGEKQANVLFCCCVNKGGVTLKASIEKNVYSPGETVQIFCEVDNQSTVAFSHMKAKLMRSITMRDKKDTEFHTETILTEQYPGVAPGMKLMGSEARHGAYQLSRRMELRLENEAGLIIPAVNGKVLKVEFWIDVECDIPWAPDVEIHLPIKIFTPPQPAAVNSNTL